MTVTILTHLKGFGVCRGVITGVEDQHMQAVPWETSCVHELDLTSTELSEETLENVLLRMPGFTYLGLGYCEFFSDKVS